MCIFSSRDPGRSLKFAVIIARLLGGICLVASIFVCGKFMDNLGGVDFVIAWSIIFGPTLFVPGILYLFFSRWMKRNRWAVKGVLIVAWIHIAESSNILVLVWCSVFGGSLLIIAAIGVLVASVLLVIYCRQSLPAIHDPVWNNPQARGFEPIVTNSPVSSAAFPLPPASLKDAPRRNKE
jgi:hypothetical protein